MLKSDINILMEECVSCFDSISLSEMGSVKLMNRIDTKYVVPQILLPSILDAARSDYYVQEIDNKRIATYDTMYYDTPTLDMYLRHHNRQLVRQKIRVRHYLDTEQTFWKSNVRTTRGVPRRKEL